MTGQFKKLTLQTSLWSSLCHTAFPELPIKNYGKSLVLYAYLQYIWSFHEGLEMIIMKLAYIFAPLLLLFCFVRGSIKNFIFYIFLRHACWINSSSFKVKIQKVNRHLLSKNLDVFPQNSKILLQTLKIILKIDTTLNSVWTMQLFTYTVLAMHLFNYCLNQLFPWNFLCSYITCS